MLCRKTAKSVLSAHVENDTPLEAVSVYLGGSKGNVVPLTNRSFSRTILRFGMSEVN